MDFLHQPAIFHSRGLENRSDGRGASLTLSPALLTLVLEVQGGASLSHERLRSLMRFAKTKKKKKKIVKENEVFGSK